MKIHINQETAGIQDEEIDEISIAIKEAVEAFTGESCAVSIGHSDESEDYGDWDEQEIGEITSGIIENWG